MMKTNRISRITLACLLGAALLFSDLSHAEQSDERARARALFEQGVELFQDENYAAALAAFEASYELRQSSTVLFNIASCQRLMFRYPAALRSFESYLSQRGDRVTPEQRAEIEALMTEMRGRLMMVAVDGAPDGAEIRVDGEIFGSAPLTSPIPLGPGSHIIEARAEGYRSRSESLSVTSPGRSALRLALQPVSVQATLQVLVDPADALVTLNGEDLTSPATENEVDPGTHTLSITADGHRPREQSIELAAGQNLVLDITLEPAPTEEPEQPQSPRRRAWHRSWWFWTIVGVVAASAIAVPTAIVVSEDQSWDDGADWRVRF